MAKRNQSTGSDANSEPRYLLLGQILRPHGIRGEVRVRILTDYPQRIKQLDTIFLGDDPNTDAAVAYHLDSFRMNQDYGLIKFKGIDDRDTADTLRQLYVMVTLENAIPLEEGEFYLYQLIGVTVQTEDGTPLGTIREVLETGANDVYILDSPQYGEILIPVTDETIIQTDISNSLVVVRLPEGLLPES